MLRLFAVLGLLSGWWLVGPAVGVATAGPLPVPDRCHEPPPCVYESTSSRRPGTVIVFHGRDWKPRAEVEALYGLYCRRREVCPRIGLVKRFRTDGRGAFTFSFRVGSKPPRGVDPPFAAGGGGADFSQGPVRRDAAPIPRPSTPEQRDEAFRLAVLFESAIDVLAARSRAVGPLLEEYGGPPEDCRLRRRPAPPRFSTREKWRMLDLQVDWEIRRHYAVQLDQIATLFDDFEVTDPALRAGVDAWVAALRERRVDLSPSYCAALRRWQRAEWSAAASPFFRGATPLHQDVEDDPTIRRGARRMRELGAGPLAEGVFGGALVADEFLIGELGDHPLPE